MSNQFRLIILRILSVVLFLVWRLTVSILIGDAVSHFLPPEHETYTQGNKVNASFQIAILPTDNSSCTMKLWDQFDAKKDKVCTSISNNDNCIAPLKTTCSLKRISTEEYELIYIDPIIAETRTSHYRLTEGRVEPLSFTSNSLIRRLSAGLKAALITLLLTLVPPFYRLWRRDREIQAAAKQARRTKQRKNWSP